MNYRFGAFSNHLLVGNFSDGFISACDFDKKPHTGKKLRQTVTVSYGDARNIEFYFRRWRGVSMATSPLL
jgi:hypothetical protein